MHDVDRTLQEFESNEMEFESQEIAGENEGFLGDILGSVLGGEMESGEFGEQETHEQFLGELGEFEFESGEIGQEAVFDEVQEMELAAELLEVANEQEMEQFLGNLIKKAGSAIGSFVKGPIGQQIGGVLKSVAKKALPIAGAALGNLIVPGVGGAIGGKLASAAGNMFGLELEGLSPQDREFEVARRFVRLAGATTQRALRTPTHIPPKQAVRRALVQAARRHAPGLLQPRPAAHRRPVSRAPIAGVRAPVFRAFGTPRVNGTSYPSPTYASPAYVTPTYATPSYVTGQTYGDGTTAYTPNAYAPTAGVYGYATPSFSRTGRWYRRGRKIVLVGV